MRDRRRSRGGWKLASGLVLATLIGLLFQVSPIGAQEELFGALELRNIGPFRGGRVTAVTGQPGDRETFFMGSTGGGVWKTEDAGVSWRPLTDGQLGSSSVGAIAVAPSDPNVVFVGTGSACPRGNISPGDGVYRSTDGGETWIDSGLRETRQIGAIRVHPRDPQRVFVAALGHAFGENQERGVFRSTDGGESWEEVLAVSEKAGAVDLAMNPRNPRVLYAAFWEMVRQPWDFVSGGEGSGLWKSTDGGDSWVELEDGLPRGIMGRIGVAISPAQPQRVWALIEAEDGGLFRSDDGGKSFSLVNEDRNLRQRAWYYTHVFADPRDEETVYVLNVGMWRSTDGGKTFQVIRAPHGDHHALWINPDDPSLIINGNDGGAAVSFNGGKTWSSIMNQPTSEMYRVTVDAQFPYRVYGCQQDNSCVSLPSRTSSSGIERHHWYVIGGCESGHVAVDPRNPEITYSGCYGGSISRYDHGTGQEREITAAPQLAIGQAPFDLTHRFQWNAPIRLSPHDPNILYHASQHVLRSTDEGASWQVISPDLSRNDPGKQKAAGGPITKDNTGVEVYGTVFALEESRHSAGELWAGTDDGRVHLSRDGGEVWKEITPVDMPEWGQVNMIELSPHDPGKAFLAVTRYKMDDFTPYVFRTGDYGVTWTLLTNENNGIPTGSFVRVVREDPEREGLLFAGTEFGLFVSLDEGEKWQELQQNLPVTPVTDLAVTQGDLVVATQGRSFWILDDLSPLRQLTDEIAEKDAHLFGPRDVYRVGGGGDFGGSSSAGKNPPGGALINYLLGEVPEEEVVLEILDADGHVLRTFSSEEEEKRAPNPWKHFMPPEEDGKLSAKAGMNRAVWNLRLADAELVEDAVLWGMAEGPQVPPGTYQARLSMGTFSNTRSFEVLKDPRVDVSLEELSAQFELARKIWSGLSEGHQVLQRLRDVKAQVENLAHRHPDVEQISESTARLVDRLNDLESQFHQSRATAPQDVLNYPPALDNGLLALQGVVESADAAPTQGAQEEWERLSRELSLWLADVDAILSEDVSAFSDLIRELDLPAVVVDAQ